MSLMCVSMSRVTIYIIHIKKKHVCYTLLDIITTKKQTPNIIFLVCEIQNATPVSK